jgi:hypothetical protein
LYSLCFLTSLLKVTFEKHAAGIYVDVLEIHHYYEAYSLIQSKETKATTSRLLYPTLEYEMYKYVEEEED